MISGSIPDYLKDLNPEQLDAVLAEEKRLLILAGAGTGKTRVITSKIAYLVREKHVAPESVLAVTFTNKAANEMKERAMAIEPACSRATIRTFHSFGAWFMRRNAQAFGLRSGFTIYDEDDSAELVHSVFPSLSKRECGDYAFLIAKAKDYCLAPDSPELGFISQHPEFRRVYAAYEVRLRQTGNVDFGDLIFMPARLLEQDEAIRTRTLQRYRVILVDEYQDSNVAQFRLLQQLAGPDTMLCVVGDDDQSIYRFRGAEIRNILNFQKVYPDTRLIRLERNYRSYQTILDFANAVVLHNAKRLGKRLLSTRPGGVKPQLALLDDQDQEIEFCAMTAKRHVQAGGHWKDIAILYRTNAQSLGFERMFPQLGIPYRIVGALRFYEREEIKDMLAFLSFLANPRDQIAFTRIVNKPARGIGVTSIDAIAALALQRNIDLYEVSLQAGPGMHGRGREGLRGFLQLIDAAREKLRACQGDLGQLVDEFARQSGLLDYYHSRDLIGGTQKEANIEELVNAASEFPLSEEGLLEFLDTIMLDQSSRAQDSDADAVTLITMHNTKGLEFPVVIVTGLEQGLFPRNDEEGEDLEEQRRLFYVAVTRAKESLYLTACRWRRMHGRIFETTPSRFLTEVDPDLYELWRTVRTSDRLTIGQARPYSRKEKTEAPVQERFASSVHERESGAQYAEWKSGMRVYHEEYGSGSIIKVSISQSAGPLVIVKFDTGKVAQFFPKYTRKLEKAEE